MTYTQQLNSDRGGMFYLVSGSYRLPCMEFGSNMTLNQPHSAQVSVSLGTGIKNNDVDYTQQAEALLAEVQRHAGSGGAPLIPCSIYETSTDGDRNGSEDRLVFRGYLVQGNLVYASGVPTSMQISFSCMGPAAVLYTRPCGEYLVEATLGNVIARMCLDSPLNIKEAMMTGDQYNCQPADPTNRIIELCSGKRIVDRIALCVACAREVYTYRNLKDFKGAGDKAVLASLGGTTKLSPLVSDNLGDAGFSLELYDRISTGLPQADIMSAIQSTACSEDYMLQLVPRWTVDKTNDFRLDLTPCTAWEPSGTVLKLTAADVISISMGMDATRALRTPDVVLMSYNEAYPYTYGATGGFSGYVMGVAGNNTQVVNYLRSKFSAGVVTGGSSMDEQSVVCRVQELPAPKWLGFVIANRKYTNVKEGRRNDGTDLTVEAVPENQADAKSRTEQKADETVLKHTPASGMATARPTTLSDFNNQVAEALFQYYYMAADTCVVHVNPALRFGLDHTRFFENHIGDTVEIDLTGAGVQAAKTRLRGELQSVAFSSTFKNTTMASYMLQLRRVRLADVKVPSVACPIYSR